MTYSVLQAVLAIPAGCLRYATAHQAGTCGASLVTWAFVVAEVHRILNKKPRTADADRGVLFRSLAMTYSHMGKPHTTIGDDAFHY